jgi:DNA-damage-inducible protein D
MAAYDDYVVKLNEIRRVSPDGAEYWMARDLRSILGYDRWENFAEAVKRAMDGCASADVPVENHFRETTKMVEIGSGGKRSTDDWFLSRYACYLIAMNGDTSKPEVGYAQTYFTVQTRRQEQHDQLTGVEQRRELRNRVKDANKGLNSAAKQAGVVKFAVFHDAGYKGLYGGLGKSDIQSRKDIPAKDDLLDCIGHAELAAHYFRITQTQQKLERRGVHDQHVAINTHFEVGREVRSTMQRISGTKPEDLPAEPSLKRIKKKKEPPEGGLLDG